MTNAIHIQVWADRFRGWVDWHSLRWADMGWRSHWADMGWRNHWADMGWSSHWADMGWAVAGQTWGWSGRWIQHSVALPRMTHKERTVRQRHLKGMDHWNLKAHTQQYTSSNKATSPYHSQASPTNWVPSIQAYEPIEAILIQTIGRVHPIFAS